MPTNRIERRFESNAVAGRGALVPYFTSGFPDVETTARLIRRADELGAACVELGVPYSDSIADGPVIQEAFNYALRRGHRVEDAFQLASGLRRSLDAALVMMVSYSIVHRRGLEAFMDRASAAGFDGLILPDVPLEESGPVSAAAARTGLCHIGLVAPTTSPARREAIAQASSGFVYRIAVAGTTGERCDLPRGLPAEVARLRLLSGLPVCVGFGISNADQVREVCAFADGAIVGSAVIRRIAQAIKRGDDADALVASVSEFLSQLIAVLSAPRR